MDDITIYQGADGSVILTVYSPMSHYGAPVLRIETPEVSGDFGPRDFLPVILRRYLLPDSSLTKFTAAGLVAAWAREPGRTPEELKAAQKFLRQWPPGPQVETRPTLEPRNCEICGTQMGMMTKTAWEQLHRHCDTCRPHCVQCEAEEED